MRAKFRGVAEKARVENPGVETARMYKVRHGSVLRPFDITDKSLNVQKNDATLCLCVQKRMKRSKNDITIFTRRQHSLLCTLHAAYFLYIIILVTLVTIGGQLRWANAFSGSLPCELLYYSVLLCYVWLNKPSSSSSSSMPAPYFPAFSWVLSLWHLSRVSMSVRAINRSASGFPNALVFCCVRAGPIQLKPSSGCLSVRLSVRPSHAATE